VTALAKTGLAFPVKRTIDSLILTPGELEKGVGKHTHNAAQGIGNKSWKILGTFS
jgi:hypothetical protein